MPKVFVLGCLLFGLGPEVGLAEKPTPHRKSKEIDLKNLLALSTGEEGASSANGVFDRGIVTREGVKYRKFESRFGSVLILDSTRLSRHEIENAMCVPGMPSGTSQTMDSTLTRAETEVSRDGDWKAYAALIQQTIRSKCDGTVPMAANVFPHLDLGLSHSSKDKDGVDTEYKLFNRDLGPNLNFGARF
jgi:hypothetical protein